MIHWITARLTWALAGKVIAGLLIGLGLWQFDRVQDAKKKEIADLRADKIQADQDLAFAKQRIAKLELDQAKLDMLYVRTEERKKEWVDEALKWKNKIAEMQNDPEYSSWATGKYMAPD